ncbi:MAG: ATP-binding protein [Pseudomonadota bacterium]
MDQALSDQPLMRYLAMLGDADLGDSVLDSKPALVFADDGRGLLFANAAGLDFLEIGGLDGLARYRLPESSPIARRVAQLARQHSAGGLERFRFFVGMRAKPAACLCRPIDLDDGTRGVLAVSVDAASGTREKPAARMLAYLNKAAVPAALYDRDGSVLGMTEAFASTSGTEDAAMGLKEVDNADLIVRLAASESAETLIIVKDAKALPDLLAPTAGGIEEDIFEPETQSAVAPPEVVPSSTEGMTQADEETGIEDLPEAEENQAVQSLSEPDLSEDADPAPVSAEGAPPSAADGELEEPDGQTEPTASQEIQDPSPDMATGDGAEFGDVHAQTDISVSDEGSPDQTESTGEGLEEAAPTAEAVDEEVGEDEPSLSMASAIERLSIPLSDLDTGAASIRLVSDADNADHPGEAETAEKAPALPPAPPQELDGGTPSFAFAPRTAPHRFVWEMDEERRFSMVTPDLADAVGPQAADIAGRTWSDVADRYGLDNAQIGATIDKGETWTGMRVDWPVEGTNLSAPVELTAMPIYDQSRTFAGYRGFGVCRTDQAQVDPQARGLNLGKTLISREVSTDTPIKARVADADDDDSDHDPARHGQFAPDYSGLSAQAFSQPRETESTPQVDENPPAEDTEDRDTPGGAAKGLLAGLAGAAIGALGLGGHREPAADKPSIESSEAAPEPVAEESAIADSEQPAVDEATAETEAVEVAAAPETAPVQRRLFNPATVLRLFVGGKTDDAERARFAEPLPTKPIVAESETETETETETGGTESPEAGQTETEAAEAVEDEAETPDQETPAEPVSNVVPLMPTAEKTETENDTRLSRPEREAFLQIAETLGARIEDGSEDVSDNGPEAAEPEEPKAEDKPSSDAPDILHPVATVVPLPSAFAVGRREVPEGVLLDRLPTGVLLCRNAEVLFANRAALALLEYDSRSELRGAGGLEAIFEDSGPDRSVAELDEADRPVIVKTRSGGLRHLFARLYSVPWAQDRALMIVLDENPRHPGMVDSAAPVLEAPTINGRVAELESILDTATDGVLVMEADGTIKAANRSAEALFDADRSAMIGANFTDYLAPESHRSALDYIDGLARNGVESVLNDGREVIGREAAGGLIPMFMTIGRVDQGDSSAKFCAVLRDITQWKKAEEDLTTARRQAETASSQKSDFLAKISHELRTPLNAIIGFSEVMLGERLGPIGTERYKEYLSDIRSSGDYIMSLINDLLDLSKIEAGKMDLTFEAVSVNDILQNCVALLQPEANRERIIIRASLSTAVPDVVADGRSLQQIILNLLSNAIKFNKKGGQVIVSSVYTETGDVSIRVRDTGIGMSDEDMRLALEPFRQVQTTRSHTGGTGLGLPLTKALVEANRATFTMESEPDEGTLIEVTFPSPRVLAE